MIMGGNWKDRVVDETVVYNFGVQVDNPK